MIDCRYFLRILLLALVPMCCVAQGQTSEEGWEVQLLESPKGREFHYMEVRDEGVTDINILIHWPSNWAYDATVNPAVAHVGSNAIVGGGTLELSPREIQLAYEDTNSFAAVWLSASGITASIHVPNNHQLDIVPMAVETLAKPLFHDGWVRRTKNSLKQNVRDEGLQPYSALARMTRSSILDGSPLQDFIVLNDTNQIDDVTKKDLEDWHSRNLVSDGAQFTVVGPLTDERAGQWVDYIVNQLPQGVVRPASVSTNHDSPRRIYMQVENAQGAWLNMMLPVTPDPVLGMVKHDIVAQMFAGDVDSPLFNGVRTQLRATYGLDAGTVTYGPEADYFYISGEVDPEKLNDVVEVISTVFDDFYADPDLAEFESYRLGFADSYYDYLTSISASAETIMSRVATGRDYQSVPKLDFWIDGITRLDIKRLLEKQYSSSDQMMIFATGPNPDALNDACVIEDFQQIIDC